MSRFNELLHGSAGDAADILSGDHPGGTSEVRAALTNALHRIDRLETALVSAREESESRTWRVKGDLEQLVQDVNDKLDELDRRLPG